MFLISILLIQIISAETTFFEEDEEFFIMVQAESISGLWSESNIGDSGITITNSINADGSTTNNYASANAGDNKWV